MAQSPVEFVNRVLDGLGTHAIQSFADNTKNAKVVARQYPSVVRELLSEGDWPHAKRRATLAQTTNTRGTGWYAYALPNHFVKPVKMLRDLANLPGAAFLGDNDEPSIPFEIDGNVYYSRIDGAVLIFISDEDPLLNAPPVFETALRAGCAAAFTFPIKKDATERDKKIGEYEVWRDRAKAWIKNIEPSQYGNFIPAVILNEELDEERLFY